MLQMPPKPHRIEQLNRAIENAKNDEDLVVDQKKLDKKIAKIRDRDVEELIFSKYLIEIENKKNKNQKITNFFKVKK